ncbi:RNA polymerase sigma factor [Sphingobacterium sp. BIGb0165]|uniref:RNA polymerase sigma factor n=1 Tax=Sphingobacterium sp. BIGb0165 TaxID=2940615 RepID=UPI0021683CD7|nr:RNA polymerase sigma factor [Sphingobacterium sp. BIGb0165]MCS4226506.1 RNA polymerase sigma-70 factor (ECF subfamily) [Sphingobacterium sp. BIGb0165]
MKNIAYTTESEMLLRLKAGDELALEELMSRYKGPLALSMSRLIKSREDIEELLQELFLRVWKNRDNLDPERYLAYLYKIAENLVYDRLRKAAREKRLSVDYFSHIIEAYSHIEEGIFDKELLAVLQRGIQQLPEQRRRVFELCKIEGKSYEEVSQLLSISVATVNSHITNANASIKAYFRQHPELASMVLLVFLFANIAPDTLKTPLF